MVKVVAFIARLGVTSGRALVEGLLALALEALPGRLGGGLLLGVAVAVRTRALGGAALLGGVRVAVALSILVVLDEGRHQVQKVFLRFVGGHSEHAVLGEVVAPGEEAGHHDDQAAHDADGHRAAGGVEPGDRDGSDRDGRDDHGLHEADRDALVEVRDRDEHLDGQRQTAQPGAHPRAPVGPLLVQVVLRLSGHVGLVVFPGAADLSRQVVRVAAHDHALQQLGVRLGHLH
mmetsp:Transcript_8582/g.14474  ORF Transcript_8582/g.14474 Transcript_8582/m.14474 type:complete len:232 (+) Transcript_8582:907-1602(+)